MLYALENGVVTGQSRGGGSATFHRSENPILFWITFLALTSAMGVFVVLSLAAFWKAFKKG